MRDEFADAWLELDADPDVRVIVHTGNGRAFQTGVDVSEIASDGVGMERYRQSMEDFDLHFTAWHQQVWKPVITAVNGICAGGGFHWVADADIVIAARDAQFFDPHVSVGQVVSIEAIGLMRKMPVEAVMRMAFVGKYERMSAERALQLGMISEIVDPPERLRERAQELAEKIAKNSPAAMAATKKALWGALELGLTDACKAGAGELVSMWGHPDQDEGPRAFAEKRDAGVARSRVSLAELLPPAGDEVCVYGPERDWTRSELPRARRGVGGIARHRTRHRRGHTAAQQRRADRPSLRHVAGRRRVRPAQPSEPPRDRARARSSATSSGPPSIRGVAVVSFTSGTTGAPKPVPLLHARRAGGARSGPRHAPDQAGRRGEGADAEPRPGVALAVGRHLPGAVRVPARRPGRADGPLRDGRVRRAGAPVRHPQHGAAARRDGDARRRHRGRRPRAAALRAQRLRAAVAAAGPPVPRPLRRRVLNGYGQTELGGEVVGWSAADSEGVRRRQARRGRSPARRRRRAATRRRARGAVAARRSRRGDPRRPLTDDGWLRTGDLGRIDDDGFVWIDGRVSDMVNRGGLKVLPGEVEEVLRLAPGDRRRRRRGHRRRSPRRGARWRSSSRRARPPTPTSKRCAGSTWRPYKVPARFVRIGELPRNEIGKVLKRDLAALATTEEGAP